MKWTRLWCNIVCQVISNGGFYFYLYPFENLIQKKIHEKIHKFLLLKFFLENFINYKWIKNQLRIN